MPSCARLIPALVFASALVVATACDDADPEAPDTTSQAEDTAVADTAGTDTSAEDTASTEDTSVASDTAVADTGQDTDDDATADAAEDTADTTPDAGDGLDADTSPPVAPVVAWRQLDDIAGLPAARWGRQAAWIDDASAWVFGGVDGSDTVQADLWRVDIAPDGTVTATEVTTQAAPAPRYCGCMAYDPASETLLVVGGRSFSAFFAETWMLDVSTGQWTEVTTSPASPSRVLGCAMAHSAHTGDFYLFGGASMAGVTDETWRFDPDASTWTQIEITAPAARYDAGMRSIDGGRSLLMFAGSPSAQSGFLADVWRFDTELEIWDPIDTTASGATPPGRRTPWMVTSADEHFLIAGFGVAGLQPGSALSDLWLLDLEQGLWSEMVFDGDVPPARGFAPALPGGASGVGLLLGGFDMSASTADGWLLERLDSGELCGSGGSSRAP